MSFHHMIRQRVLREERSTPQLHQSSNVTDYVVTESMLLLLLRTFGDDPH